MFRKSSCLAGMLFVIMAGLALTVSPAQAEERHPRDVHHWDYHHHRFYPAYHSYYHHYYPYYRFYPAYGGVVVSYSVPYYVPYYSYVPYYVPYYVPSDGRNTDYASSYYDSTGDAAVASASLPAHITVRAPANAEILFDGKKTDSTGGVREYETPPLKPGKQYTYDVTARWEENGQLITQSQRVIVSAGSKTIVTFPIQPGQGQSDLTREA
jgi:uncharacterized protein (TIGR03000 family)